MLSISEISHYGNFHGANLQQKSVIFTNKELQNQIAPKDVTLYSDGKK